MSNTLYPVWAAKMPDGNYAVMWMDGAFVWTISEFENLYDYGLWLQSLVAVYEAEKHPVPDYLKQFFGGGGNYGR
ncbi:MAG: hypothetical protein PHU08_00005 [Dehalococcoidales bacterium]|nr:hypothetical protein [Dehalococcoidales bacterium]